MALQSKNFMIEVVFFSHMKEAVPSSGYRSQIVMNGDVQQEYLDVEFYDIETDRLDQKGYVMCFCLYENQKMGYHKIKVNQTFKLMEGQHVIGCGKIVNVNW